MGREKESVMQDPSEVTCPMKQDLQLSFRSSFV